MRDYYALMPSPRKAVKILKILSENDAEVFAVVIIARVPPQLLGGLKNVDREIRWRRAWVLVPL